MVEPDLAWEITQVADTIDPKSTHYNQLRPPGQDGALRPDARRHRLGRYPRRRREGLRPRQRQDELHRLPLVVEPELLRLPPAPARQQEDAPAPQRGRRHAQLRLVQLPDPPRRRVHAGPRRRRDRQPDRPGAVVVRDPRRVVQRQPRVDLRPAADDLGRGAVGHRLQHQRAAHRPRRSACRARPEPSREPRERPRPRTRAPICRGTPTPRCAPTATSPRTTTTTRSWPSS